MIISLLIATNRLVDEPMKGCDMRELPVAGGVRTSQLSARHNLLDLSDVTQLCSPVEDIKR